MKITAFAGFMFMVTSAAHATATIEQLFLDAGSGITATIDVDVLGFVSCSGTCGGIVLTPFVTPHGTLQVSGTLGQFVINVTGLGGLSAIGATRQNLNQVITAPTGAGSLFTRFTDTDYCLGAGGCFASKFVVSASIVNDLAISSSTTGFSSFASAVNALPAGTLLGSLSGLAGLAGSAANTFANPAGVSGSLTSTAVIQFTGAGTVQASLQISTTSNTVATNVAQCMNGGWATVVRANGTGFKNQGDCVQYVITGK